MKLKWIIDCGHGWLEVERKELTKLGIENDISGFSYQKGTKVYLEEDLDAGVLFKALFNNDEYWYKNEENKKKCDLIEEKIYKNYAPVRDYASYRA